MLLLSLSLFTVDMRVAHRPIKATVCKTQVKGSIFGSLFFLLLIQVKMESDTSLFLSGPGQNDKREPKSTTMKQCRNKQSSWFINVAGVRSQAVSQRRRTYPVRSRQTGVQGNSRLVTTEIRQKTSQEGKRWKARYKHTRQVCLWVGPVMGSVTRRVQSRGEWLNSEMTNGLEYTKLR